MTETDVDLVRRTKEVRIETSRGPGAPAHRTIIWIVVDDRDRMWVRTYRGAGSRWYREALANPDCRLHVRDRVIDVRAVRADDPERIAACSDGLVAKYAGDPATPAMIRDDVLDTTLELVPT